MDFNIKKILFKFKIYKDFVFIVIDFGRIGILGLKIVYFFLVVIF